jgi:hypothetical protein
MHQTPLETLLGLIKTSSTISKGLFTTLSTTSSRLATRNSDVQIAPHGWIKVPVIVSGTSSSMMVGAIDVRRVIQVALLAVMITFFVTTMIVPTTALAAVMELFVKHVGATLVWM